MNSNNHETQEKFFISHKEHYITEETLFFINKMSFQIIGAPITQFPL